MGDMIYEEILARANEFYRASKGQAANYTHIEIRSDQVKSLLRAVVEAINAREKQSLECLKAATESVLQPPKK